MGDPIRCFQTEQPDYNDFPKPEIPEIVLCQATPSHLDKMKEHRLYSLGVSHFCKCHSE
jgi:hypothetical protein